MDWIASHDSNPPSKPEFFLKKNPPIYFSGCTLERLKRDGKAWNCPSLGGNLWAGQASSRHNSECRIAVFFPCEGFISALSLLGGGR